MADLRLIEGYGDPVPSGWPWVGLCSPCFEDDHDECNSAYCPCPCYAKLGEYDGP